MLHRVICKTVLLWIDMIAKLLHTEATVTTGETEVVCSVPNALFAANLSALGKLSPSSSPLFFLIGEFIKLIAMALLLVLIVMLYKDLVWPAMIFTMIVVLNCSFLGLLTRE